MRPVPSLLKLSGKASSLSFIISLLLLDTFASAQLALDQGTINRFVKQYQAVPQLLAPTTLPNKRRDGQPPVWRWPITLSGDRNVTLLLTPNIAMTQQLDMSVVAQLALTSTTFLTGDVEGYPAPASFVSVSVRSADAFVGRIQIEEDVYHLELMQTADGEQQVVSYAAADVQDDPSSPLHCAADHRHQHAEDLLLSSNGTASKGSMAMAQQSTFRQERTASILLSHNVTSVALRDRRALSTPAGVVPTNVDCPMYLISDLTFTTSLGGPKQAIWTMLSVLNDVSTIYDNTFQIQLPVYYAYAITGTSDATGLGFVSSPSIEDLLQALADANQALLLPKYRRDTCVVHMFTSNYFEPANNGGSSPVGLAYLSATGYAGGICDTYGYNVGVTTNLALYGYISRSNQVTITAHEVGHNFGSRHDGTRGASENAACKVASNPYLMWPSFTASANSRTFSSCSVSDINAQTAAKGRKCMYPRNAVAGTQADASSAPANYNLTDMCPAQGSEWTLCTDEISAIYSCSVLCKSSITGQCTNFGAKPDGSICGPAGQQCVRGKCPIWKASAERQQLGAPFWLALIGMLIWQMYH